MKKIFTLLTFLTILFCASNSNAQDYKSAIGLRLGYPLSISYKHFISEKGALEGIVGFRSYAYYSWINIGALYEHHMPIESINNLSWYIGGGANAYLWTFDNDYYPNNDFSSFSFGISGVIGLDYTFDNIPLNLSLDWIPTVGIGGSFLNGFGGAYGGLAARYTLGSNK